MGKFICHGCGPSSPPCRLEGDGIEPHLEPDEDGGGYCPSDGVRARWEREEEEGDD